MENVLVFFPHFLLGLTIFCGVMWGLERYRWRPARELLLLKTEEVTEKGAKEAKPLTLSRPWYIEYTAGLFPILLIVFIVRSFIVEPFKIPSSSMRPGLIPGDLIAVKKYAYGLRWPILNTRILGQSKPERGDVVVFKYPPNPRLDYIKRVVGVSGDTVQYLNKRLTVNGIPLNYEDSPPYRYLERSDENEVPVSLTQLTEKMDKNQHQVVLFDPYPPMVRRPDDFKFSELCQYSASGFTCKVPTGHYFVMGDNRDNSEDSRYWGFVPDQNLVGQAFVVWMNFSSMSRIGSIQ